MTLGGGLDFQGQTSQSLRFLTLATVDTLTVQTIDISAFIGPNDQAIVCFWQGAAGWAGLPVCIEAQTNIPVLFFSPLARVADSSAIVMPFYGKLITDGTVGGVSIQVSVPVDIGGHVTGNLWIMAQTGPPTFTPVTRRQFIGIGFTTGTVTCNAGVTTTVLPLPVDGAYYRLKSLSLRSTPAPAAIAAALWLRLDDSTLMYSTEWLAVGGQASLILTDMQWDYGIKLQNSTSVALTAAITAELWFR